ncbi:MAG: hypothetical protein Q7T80_16610 [Methanoregula sp.]|nr:hypothetical protein [Methanoregula sp.]
MNINHKIFDVVSENFFLYDDFEVDGMYKLTVDIPEQFLPVLDEIVMRTQTGTRETWAKNLIKNMLIQGLCEKDLAAQFQQQGMYYAGLWP